MSVRPLCKLLLISVGVKRRIFNISEKFGNCRLSRVILRKAVRKSLLRKINFIKIFTHIFLNAVKHRSILRLLHPRWIKPDSSGENNLFIGRRLINGFCSVQILVIKCNAFVEIIPPFTENNLYISVIAVLTQAPHSVARSFERCKRLWFVSDCVVRTVFRYKNRFLWFCRNRIRTWFQSVTVRYCHNPQIFRISRWINGNFRAAVIRRYIKAA